MTERSEGRPTEEKSGAASLKKIHRDSQYTAMKLLECFDGPSMVDFIEGEMRTRGKAAKKIAETEFLKGNVTMLRELGGIVEKFFQTEPKDVIEMYYYSSRLGDEESEKKIHQLLQKEKDANNGECDRSPMLEVMVTQCAQRGLSVDKLVEAFHTNDDNADHLLTTYVEIASQRKHHHDNLWKMYRSQVTLRFLAHNPKEYDNGMELSGKLYACADDPRVKEQIFSKYQDIANNTLLTQKMYGQFCDTAEKIIAPHEEVTKETAEWIQMAIQEGKNGLMEEGVDTFTLQKKTAHLEVLVAHHLGASPEQLIQHIDSLFDRQLLDKHSKNIAVIQERDKCLAQWSLFYAQSGELQLAKLFLDKITTNKSKYTAYSNILGIIHNPKQIETIERIDTTRMFDNTLEDIITTRRIELQGNKRQLSTLAKALVEKTDSDEDYVRNNLINKLVSKMYQLDPATGNKLLKELLDMHAKKQIPDYIAMVDLGFTAVKRGDADGCEVMYTNAQKIDNPVIKLMAFSMVTYLSALQLQKAA